MEQTTRSRVSITFAYFLTLVFLLAFSGALIAYFSERSHLDSLQKENQTLQSQVQQLQNQPSKQPSSDTNAPTTPTTTYKSQRGVAITVYAPESGQAVKTPLGIIGMVPGSWSFEASFPVVLKDGNGKVIANAPAHVEGNWMTDQNVPFAVTLTFDNPATKSGTLVLQRDNPSGIPSNDDSVEIPITF